MENIFKDRVQDYFKSTTDVKFKTILTDLGINSWDEFERFYEVGMDIWLKQKVSDVKDSYDNDMSLLGKSGVKMGVGEMSERVNKELIIIEKWKNSMKRVWAESLD